MAEQFWWTNSHCKSPVTSAPSTPSLPLYALTSTPFLRLGTADHLTNHVSISSPSTRLLCFLRTPADGQAWMADWCPSPEERNVIVGVAVSFVYAIDSFANGMFTPIPSHCMLICSANLPRIRSAKLQSRIQSCSWILRRVPLGNSGVQIQRPTITRTSARHDCHAGRDAARRRYCSRC
jgi:hypothetical protein